MQKKILLPINSQKTLFEAFLLESLGFWDPLNSVLNFVFTVGFDVSHMLRKNFEIDHDMISGQWYPSLNHICPVRSHIILSSFTSLIWIRVIMKHQNRRPWRIIWGQFWWLLTISGHKNAFSQTNANPMDLAKGVQVPYNTSNEKF